MLETQSVKRLRWLLWSMLVWTALIVVRLVWLQVVRHDELVRMAQQQQQKIVEIPAARGTIFDRTGQPLAKTLPAESINVNPLKIPDPTVAADLLSRILDLDRRATLDKIVAAKFRRSGFLWIKRKVSSDEAARAEPEVGLGGIPDGNAARLSPRAIGRARSWIHGDDQPRRHRGAR